MISNDLHGEGIASCEGVFTCRSELTRLPHDRRARSVSCSFCPARCLKCLFTQGVAMTKNTRAFLLFLGIVAPLSAGADDDSQSLAKFKGGIGVIPVSSAPGPA